MNREYNSLEIIRAQLKFGKEVNVESMMNKESALKLSRMLQGNSNEKQYQTGEKSR
tara:strand:- start:472 stop:639 length:168 start_codon:yes stop_codon:yes gene_type:complete